MEVKKSEKANLENRKLLFTEIGFVISLLVVLGAFSWTSKEKTTTVFEDVTTELIEEEIIPITQENTPPPPEAPKIPVLSDQIDRLVPAHREKVCLEACFSAKRFLSDRDVDESVRCDLLGVAEIADDAAYKKEKLIVVGAHEIGKRAFVAREKPFVIAEHNAVVTHGFPPYPLLYTSLS